MKTKKFAKEFGVKFIKEQMGKFTTSAIGHSLTYDRTDSRILPKNGYLIVGSQEFAGVGGNTKYLKHELDGKYFKSFVENKYTLKLSAAAGHIKGVNGKKVRISDRFNLGDSSLRGFAPGGIGPRDKKTDEGFGGQKYYTVSSELNFPLGLPQEFNVTGAVFADAGNVWMSKKDVTRPNANFEFNRFWKEFGVGSGLGARLNFDIILIRFDFAIPLYNPSYAQSQRWVINNFDQTWLFNNINFNFGIGYPF